MNIGERIKLARTTLGLTLSALSERTGIGESSLSEFENGKRDPKTHQLKTIAKACAHPISFFFYDNERAIDTVLWRCHPDHGAIETELKFIEWCRVFRDLERWCGQIIEPRLPEISDEYTPFGFEDARELARRIRGELGLGNRPAFTLLNALMNECGIKVLHGNFEPSGTAASTKSQTFGYAILLNSRNSRYRRNFDLAHELFHLSTWDMYRSKSQTVTDQEEKLADVFASNLLIPSEELRSVVGRRIVNNKIPISIIPELARLFDVSIDAMAWQIHYTYNLGQGNLQSTKDAIAQLREESGRLGLVQDHIPSEFPERFQNLAIQALRLGQISVARFAEILGIGIWEAMQIDQEDVPNAEIQLIVA